MAIVCGTDFSDASSHAVTAAARLAARNQTSLHLVHAIDFFPDQSFTEAEQTLSVWAKERLAREVERIRPILGEVESHLEFGAPDDTLLEVASRVSATLIVLGVTGRRGSTVALGGQAERIAQRSTVPVLMLRDSGAIERWALEAKPLRIVLCSDPSASSEAALRWVASLQAFGPCDVTAIQLYWPPEQFHRLGLGGVRSYLDPDAEVSRTLEREFFERVSKLPAVSPMKFRSEPHLGRIADRLADLAAAEGAELIVVGNHGRNALMRLWEGSVSRGVLKCARTSVACVPARSDVPASTTPTLRKVLVATDFSAVGDAAIPLAYASVAQGGTVHLVHVVERPSDPIVPRDIFTEATNGQSKGTEAIEAARSRLLDLVPVDAAHHGKATQVHVLASGEPAVAICQAAERLGADLVCVGHHGRSGVAKALLGSVAQEVVSQSKRPVLLARRPAE